MNIKVISTDSSQRKNLNNIDMLIILVLRKGAAGSKGKGDLSTFYLAAAPD